MLINLAIPRIWHTRNIKKKIMISPSNLIYWLSVVLKEVSYIALHMPVKRRLKKKQYNKKKKS